MSRISESQEKYLLIDEFQLNMIFNNMDNLIIKISNAKGILKTTDKIYLNSYLILKLM